MTGRARRRAAVLLASVVTVVAAGCADDEVRSLADVAPPAGTCFLAPSGEPGDDGSIFDEVDCAQPHAGEVLGRAELAVDGDAPFPGAEELRVAAVDACVPVFEDYVGIAYLESRYTLQPIVPDASTWADGDRSIACVAVLLGVEPGVDVGPDTRSGTQPIEGSVRGAAA